MRRTTLSLAALAFVAFAPAAFAQNASAASKLTFGVNSGSTSIDADEEGFETKSGIGYGLSVGYDLLPALRITAGADLAKIDLKSGDGDFGLTQLDLGARYSFLNVSQKFTPFMLGSLTNRTMAADVDMGAGEQELAISGLGYSVGGGVDYGFSPKLAFTGAVKYTMGSFSKAEVDGEDAEGFEDIDASGMRLQLGLTWRPFR